MYAPPHSGNVDLPKPVLLTTWLHCLPKSPGRGDQVVDSVKCLMNAQNRQAGSKQVLHRVLIPARFPVSSFKTTNKQSKHKQTAKTQVRWEVAGARNKDVWWQTSWPAWSWENHAIGLMPTGPIVSSQPPDRIISLLAPVPQASSLAPRPPYPQDTALVKRDRWIWLWVIWTMSKASQLALHTPIKPIPL